MTDISLHRKPRISRSSLSPASARSKPSRPRSAPVQVAACRPTRRSAGSSCGASSYVLPSTPRQQVLLPSTPRQQVLIASALAGATCSLPSRARHASKCSSPPHLLARRAPSPPEHATPASAHHLRTCWRDVLPPLPSTPRQQVLIASALAGATCSDQTNLRQQVLIASALAGATCSLPSRARHASKCSSPPHLLARRARIRRACAAGSLTMFG